MSNVIYVPDWRWRRTQWVIDLRDHQEQPDFWQAGLERYVSDLVWHEEELGIPYREVPECLTWEEIDQ